jgi:hypothetical protein
LEPISGAFVVGLESVVRMRVYFGAYIWSLYILVPLFGAYIWSLYLEPIFGAYIWSLLRWRAWCLFLGFAVRHQIKAQSGAFLKTWCSALYSLVAFQLTRKGLPVTTAPLAVEIPLIAS